MELNITDEYDEEFISILGGNKKYYLYTIKKYRNRKAYGINE